MPRFSVDLGYLRAIDAYYRRRIECSQDPIKPQVRIETQTYTSHSPFLSRRHAAFIRGTDNRGHDPSFILHFSLEIQQAYPCSFDSINPQIATSSTLTNPFPHPTANHPPQLTFGFQFTAVTAFSSSNTVICFNFSPLAGP